MHLYMHLYVLLHVLCLLNLTKIPLYEILVHTKMSPIGSKLTLCFIHAIQGICLIYVLQVTTLNCLNRVLPTVVCTFSTNYPVKLKTLGL